MVIHHPAHVLSRVAGRLPRRTTDASRLAVWCWRTHVRLITAIITLVGAILAATPGPAYAQSFIRDTEVENLLNEYAQPIFKAAGLGSQRIAVRIIRHESFNAFVLDGRNVFVNTGMIVQSETPNQVIGVLAHETGHIAGGHLAGLRLKIQQDATRSLLMKILGIAALVGGAAAGGSVRDNAGGVGSALLTTPDLMLERSILSYRRAQESAADQAGAKYLRSTRQSARGMLETFERFANQEYISDTYKDPFVRSHPMATQRLAQLREIAEASPFYETKDTPQLQLRHDMMRAKIIGYLDRPQTVLNRYPESDRSLPARYARAIVRNRDGSSSGSEAEIDALLREKPDNAYFWELKGEMLFRRGQAGPAIEPLRKALKMLGDSSLIRVRIAQAMLATNDPRLLDEVIAHCRQALVDDINPHGYRLLATAYYKKNQLPLADVNQAQAYFYEGDLKQAQIFAKRAQTKLRQGSPEWIKADDIINFKPPQT